MFDDSVRFLYGACHSTTEEDMKKAEFEFIVRSIVDEMVSFLMEDNNMPMLEAFDKIYNSKIFEKLQDKGTGLYLRIRAFEEGDNRAERLRIIIPSPL